MHVKELLELERRDIRALHYTWVAFFLTFYVWFNIAPLATSMVETAPYITAEDIKLFLIANVALTIPGRVFIGMVLDHFGPRRTFSILLVTMAVPTWFFAFGESNTQLFIARLFMSLVGCGFVIGIHMTALWSKPKDIGFAEGFYAGWGNFGSAAAAITIPTVAFQFFGGADGWRWAIATSGIVMAAYGVFYWFAITDGPTPDTLKKARKMGALEVSTWRDLWMYCISLIPLNGILCVLVYRLEKMDYITTAVAVVCYVAIALAVAFQLYKAISINVPILKAGVPEDDHYPFSSVAALNATYFANFGAELAVVSMLPMFFQKTWSLDPTTAGLIASTFAFVNLWARPLGGYISDRVGSRPQGVPRQRPGGAGAPAVLAGVTRGDAEGHPPPAQALPQSCHQSLAVGSRRRSRIESVRERSTMCPSLRNTVRSAHAAMRASCVTRIPAAPASIWSRNTIMICSPVFESRAPVGSSARMTDRLPTSPRAIAMRWRWPPERRSGKRSARSPTPTSSRASIARARALAFGTPSSWRGISTFSRADSEGMRL